jgi:hypothetical protein
MTDIQNRTKTSTLSPITVYWLNESRANRILLLLEELELSYIFKSLNMDLINSHQLN